jgi:hypothetical protein
LSATAALACACRSRLTHDDAQALQDERWRGQAFVSSCDIGGLDLRLSPDGTFGLLFEDDGLQWSGLWRRTELGHIQLVPEEKHSVGQVSFDEDRRELVIEQGDPRATILARGMVRVR